MVSSSLPAKAGFLLLLTMALSVIAADAAVSQQPDLYSRAQTALAAGDTAQAIDLLRQLTDAEADFAPGWGLLGRLLTVTASGVATDFRQRQQADRAIRRALEIDPGNPSYLMTLGSLMRKQQIYADARRMLNRARSSLEKRGEEAMAPGERAHLWYQLGLFQEDVYLDTRNLVFVPELPVITPDCSSLGSFCLNFTRPDEFNQYFRHAADLSEFGEDDFENMTRAFRRALEAEPTHSPSFRRLAIHLIDRGDLEAAQELAEGFKSNAPDDPWGYMTAGLVHHRAGTDSLAHVEFEAGLQRAGPDIAEHYLDISSLLRERQAERYSQANREARRWLEGVLWRKSDPLYLTPANEVRVAHLARVTLADLFFEDPAEGRWGADTEQGQIYVRYGPPERTWQVQRDASKESTVSPEAGGADVQGGGRWIFWNYGWELPNFIFQKQMRYRHISHMMSSASKSVEEEARAIQPALYTADFEILDYPVQIARFRGAGDSIVAVDLYTEVPGEGLGNEPDTLQVGLFVFAGSEQIEVFRRTTSLPARPEPQALTYSLPVGEGRFFLSLEARAPDATAAVHRTPLEIQPFSDTAISISDIVLADAVTPREDGPRNRHGFAIEVNRRLEFDPDLPLALYWEVYGLKAGEDGFANYRVTLELLDAEGKGVLARIGRVLGLGAEEDIELSYERLVEWEGDRVPEYMTIEFLDREPGEYVVRIGVEDLLSGTSATGERAFRLVAPG